MEYHMPRITHPYLPSLRLVFCGALLSFLAACQSNLLDPSEPRTAPISVTTINPEQPPPSKAATSMQNRKPTKAADLANVKEPDLWDRIHNGLQLQQYYDRPDVIEELDQYANNQAYFDLTIERAAPFLYGIVDELDRRGLPQELALLPFVESAFNPSARSGERAVGIWQFMGATAASFGLQQDWWYDARRDPQASTVAALDYLEELYVQFDQNWLLALAAYNAGDGNVRRAIRRLKSPEVSDELFWELRLPRETRAHIPRILALAKLINEDDHFGINLGQIANSEPLAREDIGAQMDFAQAAKLADMDYSELRALNPGYLQWATHPEHPQYIVLPHAHAARLKAELAALPVSEFVTWDHYEIQPGDTLSKIATQLHTRVDVLQRVNNLHGSQIIAGRALLIPRGSNTDTFSASPYQQTASLNANPIPGSYRIRSGDNLWSIARRFDLKSADIAMWNGFETDSILRPGQIISLRPGAMQVSSISETGDTLASTYVVRKGDSMASIAARFNADLIELLKQNKLDSSSLIYPGQIIQIRPADVRVN